MEAAAEAQGGRKKVEATAQLAASRHGRMAKSCARAGAGGRRVQKSGGAVQEEDKAERDKARITSTSKRWCELFATICSAQGVEPGLQIYFRLFFFYHEQRLWDSDVE